VEEGREVTAPNAELAYRVLDHIDAHPEQHNQAVFLRTPGGMADEVEAITPEVVAQHCGTTACFAGWAALLSGLELDRFSGDAILPDGLTRDIELTARDLLNLTPPQSDELFYAAQHIDEVRATVAEIFGPRPEADR
jgi:hypothetical protein